MNGTPGSNGRGHGTRDFVEIAIRFGLLALLLVTCFLIVAPFVVPVIWGTIIAVAVYPAYRRLATLLGGRERLTAALFVLVGLALLIVPAAFTSVSMIDGMRYVADTLLHGRLEVPPPPADVAAWPLIGRYVYDFWLLASENLQDAVTRLSPQLQVVGRWLAGAIGGVGAGVIEFLVSILIAGVFLAGSDRAGRTLHAVARRIAGDDGPGFVNLSAATVRSVAQGVLGVAFVQGILAAVGMFAVGVPLAALWGLLVVVLAVMQIPSVLVMFPVALYVFSARSSAVAIGFAIWCVVVSTSDNVLKPLLLGRGVAIPMVVILLGALGGMLAFGIVGLFVGAVVLALGYEIFLAWLGEVPSGASEISPPAAEDSARASRD